MSAVDSVSAVAAAEASAGRGVPRLKQPKPPDEAGAKMRKLEQATNDFEALFLSHLLKPMAKSVAKMSDGSQLGGDVMIEVAMEKMAQSLAGKGGIGLGKLLFESLVYRVPAEGPTGETELHPVHSPNADQPDVIELEPLAPETRPLQPSDRMAPETGQSNDVESDKRRVGQNSGSR